MADIKGKFITLACSLLETKPEAKRAALDAVVRMTGKASDQLDPEGWYDTKVLDAVFSAIEQHTSPMLAWAAIRLIGTRVYPTINQTVGLPKNLETPLDFVKFEAQGFRDNHRGSDVQPRRFVKSDYGDVVVEAPSPGYNCAFIEGVFDGILQMCGIKTGKVSQTRCIKKGDSTCEYHIQW